jgi:hypothetical protein
MKRTLAIATLVILLLATVGTTTVSAAQTWTSPIYVFGVKSDTSRTVGTIVIKTIDKASPTYLFTGYRLKPGAMYDLYYITSAGGPVAKYLVGSAVATRWGTVSLKGAWTTSVAILNTKPTFVLSEVQVPSTGSLPADQTMLTLSVPKSSGRLYNDYFFGQSVIASGKLTDRNGVALGGRSITVTAKYDSKYDEHVSYSATTLSDGTYSVEVWWLQGSILYYDFQASFAGDDDYAGSVTNVVYEPT